MDKETTDLVRRLCCEAGMIMEDAAPIAIGSPVDRAELEVAVVQLLANVGRMHAILDAAKALIR